MRSTRKPADTLAFEIAQEKASALGRLGRRLEAALVALRNFEAAPAALATAEARRAREELVEHAGEALWYLMVQRDASGLHNNAALIADYRVPREVATRAGPAPPRDPAPRRRSRRMDWTPSG